MKKLMLILSCRPIVYALAASTVTLALFTLAGCEGSSDSNAAVTGGLPTGQATQVQVLQGRALVLSSGCTDCHNRGLDDPSSANWLTGHIAGSQSSMFQIGPFATYAANLTPDPVTGLGGKTDRQIFNALKFGLDPDDTADVEITSTTPGQGNFPAAPHFLAPPMPWPAFRHFPDSALWAIVAYLKHGTKPGANAVPDSQGPPDFWASSYTSDKIGPSDLPGFPTANEQFAP